jgi:hypothetical protein
MSRDSHAIFSPQNNSTIRFTPRELIKYHIEHPEIPITDKDIENLVLDDNWREEHPIFKKGSDTNLLNNNNNLNNIALF